jgi:hypothetical protein
MSRKYVTLSLWLFFWNYSSRIRGRGINIRSKTISPSKMLFSLSHNTPIFTRHTPFCLYICIYLYFTLLTAILIYIPLFLILLFLFFPPIRHKLIFFPSVLWSRNYFFPLRLRLSESFGSGAGSGSGNSLGTTCYHRFYVKKDIFHVFNERKST